MTYENRGLVLAVAWAATLLASSLGIILWREIVGSTPYWLPWAHAAALLFIFSLTLFQIKLKPLREFVLILLIIFLMGFGGGWTFGVIPFIRSTEIWLIWESQTPWAISAIATHLLSLSPAFLILSYLLLSGKKRKDFFLVKGKIDAQVEPTKLLGMKKPEPWTRTGTIFALVFGLSTLAYLPLQILQVGMH